MKIIILLLLLFTFTVQAKQAQTWVDYSNSAKLTLHANGMFEFSNATYNGQGQGQYAIGNNILSMQDNNGGQYQFNIQAYTTDEFIVNDANGKVYSYVISSKAQSLSTNYQPTQQQPRNQNLPWNNSSYDQVLASTNGMNWTESDNQVYIEFLELIVGQNVTSEEANRVRQDGIRQFNADPNAAINDMQQVEKVLTQLYSFDSLESIVMFREVAFAELYRTIQQQPEMANLAFTQIIDNYIEILEIDFNTNLSLSTKDVYAYINYLQFQAMLMGQDYQLNRQDAINLQVSLVNQFSSMPLEQQQTLAFASFIWNAMEHEWISMNAYEQQQYVSNLQQQLNINNVNVTPPRQEFFDETDALLASVGIDVNAINAQTSQQAAANGMTVNQYLNSNSANLSNAYSNLSNLSMGNHAMMMNIANNIGGGDTYHYVDYNQ